MSESIHPLSGGQRAVRTLTCVRQGYKRPQNKHLKGTKALIHQFGAKEDGTHTDKLMIYSIVFPIGLLETTNSFLASWPLKFFLGVLTVTLGIPCSFKHSKVSA